MSDFLRTKNVVLGSHVFYHKSDLSPSIIMRMKAESTVVSSYGGMPIPLFDESREGWVGFPLHQYPIDLRIGDDQRSVGRPISVGFRSSYRPGQKAILQEFQSRVEKGDTGFILQANPGSGKTVVMIKMLDILSRTALVVVPRSVLVKQWIDRLLEHSSLRAEEIGVATDGKVDWVGKKVVVGLVHTLALDRFGDEFKNHFGVIIFDEVDRSIPPQTFAPVVGMFPAKYRIGASATVKRPDGLDSIFRAHLGQCFLTGGDYNRMSPTVLVYRFSKSSGKVYGSDAIRRRGQVISRLSNNSERNLKISRFVVMTTNSGRRCVVLSDRISQLKDVMSLLIGTKKFSKEDIGLFARSAAGVDLRKEKAKIANGCKIILASYGMFDIGTDIPDLAGMVYATPRRETKQSRGRIERICAGKKTPILVDIVDTAYPDTLRMWNCRKKEYDKSGLVVKEVR